MGWEDKSLYELKVAEYYAERLMKRDDLAPEQKEKVKKELKEIRAEIRRKMRQAKEIARAIGTAIRAQKENSGL